MARVHERDGDQGALPTPRAYRPCRRSHPRPSAHVSTLGLIKAARGDVGLALSSSTPGHLRRRRRRAAIRARRRTRTRVRAGRRYGHERRLEFLPVRGRGTDQQAIGPFLRERPTVIVEVSHNNSDNEDCYLGRVVPPSSMSIKRYMLPWILSLLSMVSIFTQSC